MLYVLPSGVITTAYSVFYIYWSYRKCRTVTLHNIEGICNAIEVCFVMSSRAHHHFLSLDGNVQHNATRGHKDAKFKIQ
jgi:hypothetical protein